MLAEDLSFDARHRRYVRVWDFRADGSVVATRTMVVLGGISYPIAVVRGRRVPAETP